MKKVTFIYFIIAAAVVSNSSEASKNAPLCDKNSLSEICATATFSPAPDKALTPYFHQYVNAAQAAYVSRTHDFIMGNSEKGPNCNWRQTNDRYGYQLHCVFHTLAGRTCDMFVSPEFKGKLPAMLCK